MQLIVNDAWERSLPEASKLFNDVLQLFESYTAIFIVELISFLESLLNDVWLTTWARPSMKYVCAHVEPSPLAVVKAARPI